MNDHDAGRSGRVAAILRRVLELDPSARGAYLDRVCAGDDALRGEVESLAATAAPPADFLEQPAAVLAAPLISQWPGAALALAAGTSLGPYHIVREIGRGGTATVYLAEDERLGRAVAVKVLRPEITASVWRRRFAREIELAARLQHPHILPVFDSGDADGRLWYAMPYVAGESLRQRLAREAQLPVPVAVRIAREVALALDYAHRQGVLHRDIKPANILLADGQALVADFGIARALQGDDETALTESGLTVGTPTYMSPEQCMADQPVDGRSDIYSLGCVLYQMLAGEPPFTGRTAQAVLARRLTGPVPALSTVRAVPPYLERVVTRALERSPADRFPTASEFASRLDPPEADATTVVGQAAVPHRFRFRSLAMAIVGLAALAGVVAGLLRSHRGARPPLDVDQIAVAPFDVLDPKLAVWREGLVDYLSRNLDGAGALRAVPAGVAIRRWNGHADLASAALLGRHTGARMVLAGQLVGAGPQETRLRATLIDAADRKVLAEFERTDQPDRVDRLADSLTVDLLRELGRNRPDVHLRFSSVGTASLSALKAFLQGEQSFRRAAWDSAVAHYERAVTLDSTFALAWWRMALAGTPKAEWPLTVARLRHAGRLNRGLSLHDSLLVTADSLRVAYFDTLDPGYWSHLLRQFSTLEEATRRYPEDPEVWYRLGEARYHLGAATGATAEQTLTTFDRAIALDSGFGPAYIHPVQLALESGGLAQAAPYLKGYLASSSAAAEGEGVRLAALLLTAGKDSGSEPRQFTDTASVDVLLDAVTTTAGWADSAEMALQLLRMAADRRARPGTDTSYLDEQLVDVLAYRGHLREARARMGDRAHQVFAEAAQLGVISPDTANVLFSRWLGSSDDGRLRWGDTGDRCRRTLGAVQWWAARGDTTKIQELGRRGAREVVAGSDVYARYNAAGDVALSRVGMALARRDADDAARLLLAVPDSLCPMFPPFYLFKFHLLAETGRDREAAELFDRIPLYDHENRSATAVLGLLERGRVAERLGERQKAIQCYQRVLGLWHNADRELRPFLDEARSGLQRLTTEAER